MWIELRSALIQLWKNIPTAPWQGSCEKTLPRLHPSPFSVLTVETWKVNQVPDLCWAALFIRTALETVKTLLSRQKKSWSLRTLKTQRPEICGWSCFYTSWARTYTSMANLQSCSTILLLIRRRKLINSNKPRGIQHHGLINHGVFVRDTYQPSQSLILPK